MKEDIRKKFLKNITRMLDKANSNYAKAMTPDHVWGHTNYAIQFTTGLNNWIIISLDGDLFINGHLVAKNLNARTLKKRYWDLF